MSTPNAKSDPLWIYPEKEKNGIWHAAIEKAFNLSPVIASILISKGFIPKDLESDKSIEEAITYLRSFLYGNLGDLHPPELFPDMDLAVKRIFTALYNHNGPEKILIYGDNDVDGMTATALLVDFFRFLEAPIFYYIPNRTALEKSLMLDALDHAKKIGCTLVITVDCGVTSSLEIAEAAKMGIDVIVTDHHEPTGRLPNTVATLNPKLLGTTYPDRELTGVGVAFKLTHAITNELILQGKFDPAAIQIQLRSCLDLVALGTVADMGLLVGENRLLVRAGLEELKKSKRLGLVQLIDVCDVNQKRLCAMDITTKIAPRLNSLGRIHEPQKGVDLLLSKDIRESEKLADELELNNEERKKIESLDIERVSKYLADNPTILEQPAIVIALEKIHPGIIPIITARIAKSFNRPTVLIALEKGVGKGSIRTIPEFPILPTLRKCNELLMNYGGHDYAAGLTIKEENIKHFTKHFIESAQGSLSLQDLIAKLKLDAHVSFDAITKDFMEGLELLEPFGNGNFPPLLYCKVSQMWPAKILKEKSGSKVANLKLYLKDKDVEMDAIAFSMADRRPRIMPTPESRFASKLPDIEIAFTPHMNYFQDKASIQLVVRDFRPLD